jgi:hypothetical protein
VTNAYRAVGKQHARRWPENKLFARGRGGRGGGGGVKLTCASECHPNAEQNEEIAAVSSASWADESDIEMKATQQNTQTPSC